MNLAEKAKAFATIAHAGQFRRDMVTPYIEHPARVAELVKGDELAEAVAWLHDVLEDTEITKYDLADAGFPYSVVASVIYLTKKKHESYATFLRSLKSTKTARKVKIADMLANLTDDPTPRQVEKYTKGILFLVD